MVCVVVMVGLAGTIALCMVCVVVMVGLARSYSSVHGLCSGDGWTSRKL